MALGNGARGIVEWVDGPRIHFLSFIFISRLHENLTRHGALFEEKRNAKNHMPQQTLIRERKENSVHYKLHFVID